MASLRGLHPVVRQRAEQAIRYAQSVGIRPVVTSGKRSRSKQIKLYGHYQACLRSGQQGRVQGCMFPANPPGQSAHEYGLAFDSYVPPNQVAAWTQIREAFGFRVPDNDWVHGEVPNWRSKVHVR